MMTEFLDLTKVNDPDDNIEEQQGYIIRDGKHLFYTSYAPKGSAEIGIVLVSPFAEEKVRTLRIFVSLSRALAKLGMTVLYFDYFGDGDSEGNFEEATFEDRLADIKGAVNFVKENGAVNVGLLGLRWGATLSALAADMVNPAFLVLWEPIVDTERYFFDHLRSHIASQMLLEGKVIKNREALVEELEKGGMITVEGYNIDGGFFIEARENGLAGREMKYDGQTLIVQIARNTEKIRKDLDGLKEVFASAEIAAVIKEFEWEKTETWNPAPAGLFNATFEFLAKHRFVKIDRQKV